MRKLIISLLIAVPLLGGAAYAASDSGTVSDINNYTGTVRLSDGATYYMPNRILLNRIREGDVVRIQYDREGGSRIARDIEKTGRTEGSVVTPTRDVGVRNNFVSGKSTMCDPTPEDRNPCYNMGGQ
jgi:hypothetical protein